MTLFRTAIWLCALSLAFVTGAPRAQAQSLVSPECVSVKGGERVVDLKVLRPLMKWTEVEGAWRGTWVPADPENWRPTDRFANYNGTWRKVPGNENAKADLQIYIDGDQVRVTRQEGDQHCTYRGAFQGDWRVVGTYTCTTSKSFTGWLPWSAMLGNGAAPLQCSAGQTPDARLNVMWTETEGDWRARWTPRGGRGDYDGHWTHVTESASAGLQITINGANVQIRRTQPEGTCNYSGTFGPNGWTASGTYLCSWHHGRLPWSAVIGPGHP